MDIVIHPIKTQTMPFAVRGRTYCPLHGTPGHWLDKNEKFGLQWILAYSIVEIPTFFFTGNPSKVSRLSVKMPQSNTIGPIHSGKRSILRTTTSPVHYSINANASSRILKRFKKKKNAYIYEKNPLSNDHDFKDKFG